MATSLFLAMAGTVFLGIAGIGGAAGVYNYYASQLPPPDSIASASQSGFQTTRIFDRTGRVLLWEIFDEGERTYVPLEQIPEQLRLATIAIEDQNFYANPGFAIEGILRAALADGFRFLCSPEGTAFACGPLEDLLPTLIGAPFQGGSSITQQLSRNVLLPEERLQRTIPRKIKETILAIEITRLYDKDRILEWYLNTNFYGNLAYGVQAAAENYFRKSVQDLTLAESAMLAALPASPIFNNPLDYRDQARLVQNRTLDAMYIQEYITLDEALEAKAEFENLEFYTPEYEIIAPHFANYVRQELETRYGSDLVLRGGLRVYTTVDLELQTLAEQVVRDHVAVLQAQERDVTNGALVALKPTTGEILAMVGSVDYRDQEIDGQFNNAVSPRQPGSSFKIFTYTEALLQGYTPASFVMDVRTTFDDFPNPPYSPENYDRRYHGPLRFRQALARSINIPAVRVLSWIGLQNVLDTAHRMGINTLTEEERYGLSLTLGGGEVRLLDMAYAYSVLANGGAMAGRPIAAEILRPGFREVDPVSVLRVEDALGNVLEEYRSPTAKQVLSPQVAHLMNSIFSDNAARAPAFGTNNSLWLGPDRPAGAKTGTTDDYRDAWTIGYVPQLVAAVWVGNADNQPMDRVPGSVGAAPIWNAFMLAALEGEPVIPFVEPPGLERAEVDAVSGLLPTEYSPGTIEELFLPGTVPTAFDNIHQAFRICRPSGKLATVYCPPDLVDEVVFQIFPPEAADWVRDNEIPQPPAEYDETFGPTPATGDVAIISPRLNAHITGLVQIVGNARGDFQLYRLHYGPGLNPEVWIPIGGDHHSPVSNGGLEVWDTLGVEDGLYSLQLMVQGSGGPRFATIQVMVDNTPPELEISYPPGGSSFLAEDFEWVLIHADATDNLSMDRAEFFVDADLIAVDTVPPYNQKWIVHLQGQAQTHCIFVVAYDAAGNWTATEGVKFQITADEIDPDAIIDLGECPARPPVVEEALAAP
ncbi:MAG: penicillin-binding protein [Anaerolineae bacterium]